MLLKEAQIKHKSRNMFKNKGWEMCAFLKMYGRINSEVLHQPEHMSHSVLPPVWAGLAGGRVPQTRKFKQ